jgi:transcriptional regulator with XRE-family HTH domain
MKRKIFIDSNITDRVFRLMKSRGITQYKMAKECNIPISTITGVKKGRYNWRIPYLNSLANFFGVTIDELVNGNQNESLILNNGDLINKKRDNKIPVIGSVHCGESDINWLKDSKDFIEIPNINHLLNPFVLIAKGDSMYPYIENKDKLLCAESEEKIQNDKPVVVSFKSPHDAYEANAKFIKWINDDMVYLYSSNQNYKPSIIFISLIHKIYKIVRIIRDIK